MKGYTITRKRDRRWQFCKSRCQVAGVKHRRKEKGK
jgi:hypothetical protein